MNRNSNSHFAQNPNIDIERSVLDRSHSHKTTMNAGKLVPIMVDEVLPGDTVQLSTASLVRMSTPIFPVMDNAYLDIYYFFVPNRLVWDHWQEFCGENTKSAWEQTVEYEIPQISPPTNGWQKGDLCDYMGVPTKINGMQSEGTWNYSINALPVRAYALIWNEFFRSESIQDPVLIDTGDSLTTGTTGETSTPQTQILGGGGLLYTNKFFDYFTGALPEPQRGPEVLLPLGNTATVKTNNGSLWTEGPFYGMMFRDSGNPDKVFNELRTPVMYPYTNQSFVTLEEGPEAVAQGTNVVYYPTNLYADLSTATAATINELRLAFQIQKLYEKDARGGTRYISILKNHFSVTSPDARLQRPEYLGGERIPINVDQVVQNSATVEGSTPQGNMAAYSLTGNVGARFTHSFVEHGYLIGLATIRTDHTYQQGLEKLWSRKKRLDFYWPVLANIGEQAILNKEIFLQTLPTANENAFGYQEAWAEYRYKPSRVSGAFRSNLTEGSLDSWHYADYYTGTPILGDQWLRETTANVDRTLAVQSELEDQFICDFYFKNIWTRPMPIYSIPGLIDHH